MHMQVPLSALVALGSGILVRSNEAVVGFELMTLRAAHVHHIVVDSIIVFNLIFLILSFLQEFLHLFDTVMGLVFVNLVDFDWDIALWADLNSLRADFLVLFYLFLVDLCSTTPLTKVLSELAVILMFNSLGVWVTN